MLAGALATLVVTVVVQVWIVPRAQSRTRRLERWEDQLNELDNLLRDQLKRAVGRFRSAAVGMRHFRELVEDMGELSPAQAAYVQEEQQKQYDGRRDAQETVNQHLDRVGLLVTRVRQIQPRSRS